MLNQESVAKIIDEIQDTAEVNRRAMAKRRHDIYKDGGKAFLVEKILREFGQDSLSEMRLAPINLLKKIVDKRAGVYKRPPSRTATDPNDQALVDHYVKQLSFNTLMQKANRYLVLSSNTAIYIRPHCGELKATVVPSYQYSIVPNPHERTEPEIMIFSAFVDEGRVAPQESNLAATGVESFSELRQDKIPGDVVDSREKDTRQQSSQYIFWSDDAHFTTDENGSVYADPNQDETQFMNPIGEMPIVNLARDRDNEVWATQGEDMIDLTMALQLGWSDVLTIAKHQGFSILTITSEEEPKKLSIGINRAVWLKTNPTGPQPSIGYVQGNSPLAEYKELLTELLGLLLTTNNMDPNAIGGKGTSKTFTSGFHALISMADSLEAIEADKPLMLAAEEESWEIIKGWHNWMFDMDMLEPELRAVGKFSESFELNVQFADIRPIESEDERIARVKTLMEMNLLTREQALKKLNPDLTDEMITQQLLEIDGEKSANIKMAQKMIGGTYGSEDGVQPEDGIQEYQDGAQVGETPSPGGSDSSIGEDSSS